MTIVLNENEWAEDMIISHTLGKKPFETLRRVARYYIDNGKTRKDVRHLMDVFLLQCDPTASLPKWSDSLDKAVSLAYKYPAVNIEGITVTKPEMERIDSIPGKQIRRLAFTLLCLAKYWNTVNSKCNGWVNNKDSDIMRMANINTSIKRQSMMYHSLNEMGLIRFSRKVDNTSVQVCFIEDGEAALHITDFRNLGYQYMMYHGEPFFVCENCGITEKIADARGRKQKYCKSCLSAVALRRRVERSMAYMPKRENGHKKYTVYMHEFPDGRVYVGTTSQSLQRRWRGGLGYTGYKAGRAIEECGWENVRHYVLFEGLDKKSAQAVEAHMIQKKKAYMPEHGYNIYKTSCFHVGDDSVPHYTLQEVDGNGVRC